MNKKRKMERKDALTGTGGRKGMNEGLRPSVSPVPDEDFVRDSEALRTAKVDPEEYARYVKEHNQKLRRLQREARGDNMEFPE